MLLEGSDRGARRAGSRRGVLARFILQLTRLWLPLIAALAAAQISGILIARRRGRLAEASLIESERRFRDIAENANEWIWEVDAEGRYTYSSSAIERILGYTVDEVLQLHFYDLFHPNDREAVKQEAFKVFEAKQSFTNFVNRNCHKNGQSVWLTTSGVPIIDGHGKLLGYRGADTVKHEEASMVDPLSGLLNRQGFELLAEHQLQNAIRSNARAVLLLLDMDDLKGINDRYGHAEGDRAIADVAGLLKRSARASDVVGRLGGDEFVVLLTGVADSSAEDECRANLDRALAESNSSSSRLYPLGASIGSAVFEPSAPRSMSELLAEADAAMYEEKRARSVGRSVAA